MRFTYLCTLIVLAFGVPALPAPHDHQDDSMDMTVSDSMPSVTASLKPAPESTQGSHMHGMPVMDMLDDLEPQQKAYWNAYNATTFFNANAPNKGFFWAHVFLTAVSWVGVFPFVLMMGVEDHPLYGFAQTFQTVISLAALFCLAIFGFTCPNDLYPNNAYSKMSVILFFYVIAHWLAVFIKETGRWFLSSNPIDESDYAFDAMRGRPSFDSGHAYDDADTSNEHAFLVDDERQAGLGETDDIPLNGRTAGATTTNFRASSNRFLSWIMNWKYSVPIITRFRNVAELAFVFLHRPLFFYAYIYLIVGITTGYRLALGHWIFNLLAHLIKGSVFLLYGLLTLGRYLGAFKNHGMAWNMKPQSKYDMNYRQRRDSTTGDKYLPVAPRKSDKIRLFSRISDALPSMEFVESGLILFYGSTNIFMEHLGNETGEWSHKDLQHLSIAFMYIGGGLCGVLLESNWARKLCGVDIDRDFDCRYGFSFNPFPAFIVFWTGILMSQHTQELALSTTIHKQWGMLLVVASLFRLFTYLMLYVSTPQSTMPSRPFTELVVSFCLICGGMVFMESNSQTIEAMMYEGLDGMFTLNVNVGVAALIMAYEMLVMTFKGLVSKNPVA